MAQVKDMGDNLDFGIILKKGSQGKNDLDLLPDDIKSTVKSDELEEAWNDLLDDAKKSIDNINFVDVDDISSAEPPITKKDTLVKGKDTLKSIDSKFIELKSPAKNAVASNSGMIVLDFAIRKMKKTSNRLTTLIEKLDDLLEKSMERNMAEAVKSYNAIVREMEGLTENKMDTFIVAALIVYHELFFGDTEFY
jgi:hypothetical protein